MRVNSVKASNFASYKKLEFDFSNQGLTLIQGPTGSGKSTLCDLIPWTVFGKTAKGGTVAEVLSWPGDEITNSIVWLDTVTISRSRGPYAKDNDLTYWPVDGVVTRGKDIPDTQRLINEFLGMDYDLYLAGAYYHEFSQTAQFFTTTAANRRVICERLVDLTLAKTLQSNILDQLKTTNKEYSTNNQSIIVAKSNIAMLQQLQVAENTKYDNWNINHKSQIARTTTQYEQFEASRKRIVSKKCNSCGTVLAHPKEVINTDVNPFLSRLEGLFEERNPHTDSKADFTQEILSKASELQEFTSNQATINNTIEEYELLQRVVSDYRSLSIMNTIKDIESKANQILTDHFDAELRILLEVEQADKLDVTIYKDGNVASYTQLSKGQRCLLKLAFGLSVMQAVANHHGINFSQIFLDEALDGLDDNMKVKAYRLLETISQLHESVFVVEHSSALKELFHNSFSVELTNEGSVIG